MSEDELQTGITLDSDYDDGQPESAPGTGENQEENNEGDSQLAAGGADDGQGDQDEGPAGYTKAINRKHYQMMEEKRRADQLAQELEQLKAKLPPEQSPVVPDMPDPYDDDYAAKMKARDEAILAKAQYDGRQQAKVEQEQAAERQRLIEQQQEAAEREKKFVERAGSQGITQDILVNSLQTVQVYGGIGVELANHVMGDEQGPAITAYLAQNPDEIMAIQSMGDLNGAIYIESVVKSKISTAQQTSNAPDPVETLGGGGAPPQDRGPSGATFE